MKMWAVFDKDGKRVSDACTEDQSAWWSAYYKDDGDIHNFTQWTDYAKHSNYTCSPVVVMREEVYNEVVSYVNRIIDNTGHDPDYAMDATSETYKQFLKAGE